MSSEPFREVKVGNILLSIQCEAARNHVYDDDCVFFHFDKSLTTVTYSI